MSDGLKDATLLGSGKNQGSKGRAIERSVVLQHALTEGLDDGAESIGPWSHNLARQFVGVHDGDSAPSETAPHGALARRDTSGESKHVHARDGDRPRKRARR